MEAVRIYWRSGAGFIEVATLSPIGPPCALEGSFEIPEDDIEHVGGEGLYLALVQGGHVSDLARMIFCSGDSRNDDGEEDYYSPDLLTCRGSSSHSSGGVNESEKHTFGLMGWEEGRWEDKITFSEEEEEEEENDDDDTTSSEKGLIFWKQGYDEFGSEDDEVVGKGTGSEEEHKLEERHQEEGREESHQEENDDNDTTSSEGKGLIFWQEGHDEFRSEDDEDVEKGTGSEEEHKSEQSHQEEGPEEEDFQTVQMKLRLWPSRKHALVKIFRGKKWIITKDYCLAWLRPEEMDEFDFRLDFDESQILRESDFMMDFEILMAPSHVLNDVVAMIKPSICNFTILKKVGGANDCKVLKCSWLGINCAIKAVAVKISCTTEPRTLKHALLYEHRDWFPNRWFLLEEILQAIKKIHAELIVHRDLKPDNIFFGSDNGIRIGDFGDACIGHDELGLYGGTPGLGTEHYLAPELNSDGKITEKVDIYSAGIIMFELFALIKTGSEKIMVLPELREKGPPDSWEGDHELYAQMTALESSQRPSAAEILEYIDKHHRLTV
ncbi:hypothetical protein CFC21_103676 [Triticum aestivum]|uniref:non-specific serine/threonine protein kinase n=2 Tax=Triticum aestivum TaxID=4565 RepID=A0A3B6SHN9_WHEAT|nr:hypothetical protein CFC21_103676 [Triticum aestivum]